MQKLKEPQDRVFGLVDWVEDNQSKIVKRYDGFEWEFFLVVAFLLVTVVGVGYAVHDFLVTFAVVPVSLVAIIAFFTFIFQGLEKRRWIKRFERATELGSFDEKQKVLLKALIKMKSENEKINLKTLYEMDKEAQGDIFTEKSLLQIICT